MAIEWTECTLADACSSIDYGLTASASDDEAGPRFLRITDIVSGHIDWSAVPYVVASDATTAKYRLRDGDIVLARTGASTGASAYVQEPPTAVFASYLVRLTAKPEFDPRFLAYYLRSNDFWSFIRGVLGDKSAQPNASASTMTKAPLRAPRDRGEQRAIAHILGALDDKIELNRRMSETLDEMARALFKSWFLDFDPARAKAAGRDPRLPKQLADLFPVSFVGSEMGEIPEGWGLSPLSDCVEVDRGLSYKGAGLSESGMPMHNLNSVFEGGGYKHEGVKHYRGEYKPHHVARAGDLIVANTEQGHKRLLIGYAAIVPDCFGGATLFSHHIYRVRPKRSTVFTPDWLCHLLNSGTMHDTVSGYANGTTVNMLPVDGLRSPTIVVPPPALIRAFDGIAAAARKRQDEMKDEAHTLAHLRDLLLPRLISGEMRLDKASRLVEVAPRD